MNISRNIVVAFLLASVQLASSQSLSQSYVTSRTMTNDSGTACREKIDYYDGLGRPVETVLKGESPDGRDIATLQVYDEAGRACAQWLPIAVSNQGRFVTPNEFRWKAIGNPVYEKDAEPFSRTVYEPSPLNHVAEQYGAGAEMGIPLAFLGNYISDFGSILELGIDALNAWSGSEENSSFSKDLIYLGSERIIDFGVGKLTPNAAKKIGDNNFNLGDIIFKQSKDFEIIVTERTVDYIIQDKEKDGTN